MYSIFIVYAQKYDYSLLLFYRDNQQDGSTLPPTVRKRAAKVLKEVLSSEKGFDNETNEKNPDDKATSAKQICKQCCCSPEQAYLRFPHFLEPPKMSTDLAYAESLGMKMGIKFMYPALPKFILNLWVLIELCLTYFQFILSLLTIEFSTRHIYKGLSISLSGISLTLATIDGFLTFYSSCKACYQKMKGTEKEKKEKLEKEESTSKFSKLKNFFNTWFEIIRTVLSELLIYPLVVLSLYELMGSGTFRPTTKSDKLNFSLFIVGSFFFVVSVYVIRIVMTVSTMFRFKKLSSANNDNQNPNDIILWFFVHLIQQIIVHLLCIVAVGIKMWQEREIFRNDRIDEASPFFWLVIFGGWVIPLLGVVAFFVTNFYWLHEFSIGVFLNMITMVGNNEKKLKRFQEKVKKEFKERKTKTNLIAKLLYPLKVPIFLLFVILYYAILLTFCASLLLAVDNGQVTVALNLDSTGVAILFTIVFLLAWNAYLLMISNLWTFVCLLFAVLLILLPPLLLICLPIVLFVIVVKRRKSKSDHESLDHTGSAINLEQLL